MVACFTGQTLPDNIFTKLESGTSSEYFSSPESQFKEPSDLKLILARQQWEVAWSEILKFPVQESNQGSLDENQESESPNQQDLGASSYFSLDLCPQRIIHLSRRQQLQMQVQSLLSET